MLATPSGQQVVTQPGSAGVELAHGLGAGEAITRGAFAIGQKTVIKMKSKVGATEG
jgi:hypothetical protein